MKTRFRLGLLVVVAIAVGSIAAALIVGQNERDALEIQQDEEAMRAAHQTEALAALSVGQLASAAAFYEAEGDFSQHEFEVVAESLLETGALSATAFIQSVPREERAAYERELGARISERAPIGTRPAGDRPIYFPVTYAAGNDRAAGPPFGYDLGVDDVRGRYLHLARDRGRPTATEALRLLVGGTGINVYRPVYRDGAPTGTVAQRRAALTGFAAGAFRISDLASAATEALPEDAVIQLQDNGETFLGPERRLEDASNASVQIADRTWQLVVEDPSEAGIALPILMAFFGLMLAALLAALVLIWSRSERMRILQRQASQDPLTGLKNRRRFEEDLRTELARSRRERSTGALLMLDVDNFKQVNDTLGHPTGDKVIEEIAGVLDGRMRETDVLARVGGDEFAVVLPRCEREEATAVGAEITRAVRDHVPAEEGIPRITISVGIAMFGIGADLTFEEAMSDADQAMYAAKAGGRDGVRVSDGVPKEA
ncbi:MAG TPA: diguanylate cyclase [Solirubrobacterales bacterium]